MGWTNRWRKRLRTLVRRGAVERELDEELAYHLELEIRKNLEAGMSAGEARRQAALAFGGVDRFKEEVRAERWLGWLSGLSLDLKLGARMLIKYPGLTVIGGLGLAVAIAIGAGFFSFINSYAYATLPLDEGDRIVALENWDVEVNNEARRSVHDFVLWREEMRSVREISAFRTVVRNVVVPGRESGPVQVAEMTASGFEVARVAPVMGRPVLEEDERPGAQPVLVIGFDEWQTRFGADPDVVGREVRLGDTPYTVIGVMPEGFGFPVGHSFWTPLYVRPSEYERGEGPEIFVFGRLAPSVSMEEAQAELTAIGRGVAAAYPEANGHLRPAVLPYAEPVLDIQGMTRWEITVIQYMASLLLLVIAVNVAILVYARTATRIGEITIRTALGASRRRIVTQLFLEALVLSSGAALFGLLLLRFGMRLGQLDLPEAFWIEYGIDSVTVLYVVALAVLAAVIVGVIPALQATGPRLRSRLSALSGGTGPRMGRTWTTLVVVQVAIAVAALPAAVAMGWNGIRGGFTVPTFDVSDVLVLRLNVASEPGPGVDPEAYRLQVAARYASLQPEMIRRLSAEPGVGGLSYASSARGFDSRLDIEVEESAGSDPPERHTVSSGGVAPDYFDLLGVQILGGRGFNIADLGGGSRSIIVNQAFVQQALRGGDALGRRIRISADGSPEDAQLGEPYEIVGVVENLEANPLEPKLTPPVLYHPLRLGEHPITMAVRPTGIPAAAISARAQEIAAELDPGVWVVASPLDTLYAQQEVSVRLVALVIGLFLLSVLLLSAGGIYSLMSFTVTRRQREIGIRTALGANPRQIVRAVFSRAAGQLAVGIATGVSAGFLLDTLVAGEMLGGNAVVLLPLFAVVMMGVGMLAALRPALRGLRTQPMEALRQE